MVYPSLGRCLRRRFGLAPPSPPNFSVAQPDRLFPHSIFAPARAGADIVRSLQQSPLFEEYRQAFEATTGLLVEKVGGPSVRPYQAPGVWEAVAVVGQGDTREYVQDKGDAVYRRSVYTFAKRAARRAMVDGVREMNEATYEEIGDPEIHARIEEYEMAFRMQTTVPELTDLSGEPAGTFERYGPNSRVPGTFANQCLMARRMAERGVRFTQIFSRGWDSHRSLPKDLPILCEDIDRPCYALITDLKRRGMLDDTLVVWGGEFGRTVYSEGVLKRDDFGRDHHGKCFTMWMSGGGIKPGLVYGETDDFSYNIVRDPVHVSDLNATILHQLGLDHERLSFKFEGLDQRLTGTRPAKVITGLLA
jgi:hypothetical protein